jgi:hypothetical protein
MAKRTTPAIRTTKTTATTASRFHSQSRPTYPRMTRPADAAATAAIAGRPVDGTTGSAPPRSTEAGSHPGLVAADTRAAAGSSRRHTVGRWLHGPRIMARGRPHRHDHHPDAMKVLANIIRGLRMALAVVCFAVSTFAAFTRSGDKNAPIIAVAAAGWAVLALASVYGFTETSGTTTPVAARPPQMPRPHPGRARRSPFTTGARARRGASSERSTPTAWKPRHDSQDTSVASPHPRSRTRLPASTHPSATAARSSGDGSDRCHQRHSPVRYGSTNPTIRRSRRAHHAPAGRPPKVRKKALTTSRSGPGWSCPTRSRSRRSS